MNKIATLGPKGTFSELAVNKYSELIDKNVEIVFYPTIAKVFNAIGRECEFGIIPIENTLDGYVQITLDLLSQRDLNIIYEIVVPIQFAFVGNSPVGEIEKVYVQFKTQGQCYKFLEQYSNFKIITTESNGESFEQVKKGISGESAIIPKHILNTEKSFNFQIETVTDSKENETRFIMLSKESINYDINKRYKTSIVIIEAVDKPGVLSNILNEFSQRGVNLASIMSRPTKKALGKYHFFIDIDGRHPEDKNIKLTIDKIREKSVVKVLGSYSLI
ncbi:prephenate dehydratase [Clostridium sp. WILCCON 0269]|uniref:Prephenate dehydratase n=1 Tax=Candidatus Clostridium eludens TaxID=3381663 RepID=A0ABW8SLE4_9CLOT